jgi:hypothetical protein
MKIDRGRFLVLTGAISAAIATACATEACSTATTATPDAGGPGDSGSGQDVTSPGDTGGGTETGGGGDARGDGPTTCDDSVGSKGACVDFADGGTGPDADDGGDAGAGCLDGVVCDAVLRNLKPKVAEKAITCIVGLPTCEVTPTSNPIGDCVATALAGSCSDTTGKAPCDEIATKCADAGAADAGPDGGLSAADCQKLTAGMTSDGRAAFVTCMTDLSCEVTDPKQCLNF